ncbi:MAG: hypothetical protein SGILL_001014 [Bacillariaceae sp.]
MMTPPPSQNHSSPHYSRQASSSSSSSSKVVLDATTTTTAATTDASDKYLGPFGLQLHNFQDTGGRGVQSNVDRPVGELLLEIPVEDTITSSQLKSSSSVTTASDNDLFAVLFQHANGAEERLAIELLRRRDQNKDPYIKEVLPKEHYNSIWTLPDDLWDALRSKCLPRCYLETFQATRDRVMDFCTRMLAAQEQMKQPQQPQKYSVDDFLWAFSMVRSRSVAVPELQPEASDVAAATGDDNHLSQVPLALIPGLDLLNHDFDKGSATQLQLVKEEQKGNDKDSKTSWWVSSNKPIEAGEQVFLSYGDDKDNWKLLLTYGFAVSDNPNSLVFWSWRDLLDAASKVRPTIFQERVCAQLLRHPQLQAYTTLSEDRATFSFDAKHKQPRESLSNGLVMLANLVTQLGQPSDDKIGDDVLRELIRQRIDDLQRCQEELEKQIKSIDDDDVKQRKGWIPFLGSLQVAINQEEKDLT